ncbi:MAG: RHS repeat-associated core domain-containing protein, partial [Myxococcota bacterium]
DARSPCLKGCQYHPTSGRLERIHTPGGATFALFKTPNARGQAQEVELPLSGRFEQLVFDEMGRTKERSVHSGSATGPLELRTTHVWGTDGQLMSEVFDNGISTWANTYQYNGAGQLIEEYNDWNRTTHRYTLDRAGNRLETRQSSGGAFTTTLSVSYAGALVDTVNSAAMLYDDFEDVATDWRGNTYARTADGKVSAIHDGSTTFDITRDPLGLPLLETTSTSTATTQALLHWDLSAEGLPLEVESGADVVTYVNVGGRTVGRLKNGVVLSDLFYDNRGSLIQYDNIAKPELTAFGEGMTAWPDDERFVYARMEALPVAQDLHLARHRVYDATLGRFLGSDPTGHQDLTRYAYARANPMRFGDPMGLQSLGTDPYAELQTTSSSTARSCSGSGGSSFNLAARLTLDDPAIVQGAAGGAASPFGPGVNVRYLWLEGMGDAWTFAMTTAAKGYTEQRQEGYGKFISWQLVAMDVSMHVNAGFPAPFMTPRLEGDKQEQYKQLNERISNKQEARLDREDRRFLRRLRRAVKGYTRDSSPDASIALLPTREPTADQGGVGYVLMPGTDWDNDFEDRPYGLRRRLAISVERVDMAFEKFENAALLLEKALMKDPDGEAADPHAKLIAQISFMSAGGDFDQDAQRILDTLIPALNDALTGGIPVYAFDVQIRLPDGTVPYAAGLGPNRGTTFMGVDKTLGGDRGGIFVFRDLFGRLNAFQNWTIGHELVHYLLGIRHPTPLKGRSALRTEDYLTGPYAHAQVERMMQTTYGLGILDNTDAMTTLIFSLSNSFESYPNVGEITWPAFDIDPPPPGCHITSACPTE